MTREPRYQSELEHLTKDEPDTEPTAKSPSPRETVDCPSCDAEYYLNQTTYDYDCQRCATPVYKQGRKVPSTPVKRQKSADNPDRTYKIGNREYKTTTLKVDPVGFFGLNHDIDER